MIHTMAEMKTACLLFFRLYCGTSLKCSASLSMLTLVRAWLEVAKHASVKTQL